MLLSWFPLLLSLLPLLLQRSSRLGIPNRASPQGKRAFSFNSPARHPVVPHLPECPQHPNQQSHSSDKQQRYLLSLTSSRETKSLASSDSPSKESASKSQLQFTMKFMVSASVSPRNGDKPLSLWRRESTVSTWKSFCHRDQRNRGETLSAQAELARTKRAQRKHPHDFSTGGSLVEKRRGKERNLEAGKVFRISLLPGSPFFLACLKSRAS